MIYQGGEVIGAEADYNVNSGLNRPMPGAWDRTLEH